MSALVLAAVFTAGVLGLTAQTFRTSTELVTVPVTVTSTGIDQRVRGLGAADFLVFEDGAAQTIRTLDEEQRPVSICVAFDFSSSMTDERLRIGRHAVQALIDGLHPDDEMSVMAFGTRIKVALPWTAGRDHPAVDLSRPNVGDDTVLHDALAAALVSIDGARHQRTAIILVTDGWDTRSRVSIDRLARTRRQSEVRVYGLRPDPLARDYVRPPGPSSLPDLVGDSGGVIFSLFSIDAVTQATPILLDELRTSYTIGYEPTRPPDGKYRRITVQLRRDGLEVRHRGGYLATPREP